MDITRTERKLIEQMGDRLFGVQEVERWINRRTNAQLEVDARSAIGVKSFYLAIHLLARSMDQEAVYSPPVRSICADCWLRSVCRQARRTKPECNYYINTEDGKRLSGGETWEELDHGKNRKNQSFII